MPTTDDTPSMRRSTHLKALLAISGAGLLAVTAFVLPAAASVRNGRFAVGDSVMKGAEQSLRHRGFAVDASVSRQVDAGIDVLRARKSSGSLPEQVVVHLGTNGTFSLAQCHTMHRIVGKARNLYLVTIKVPRSWEAPNNKVIDRCAAQYSNTFVIDWKKYASRHSGLTYSDGYHLTPYGAGKYAKLIDSRVDELRNQ